MNRRHFFTLCAGAAIAPKVPTRTLNWFPRVGAGGGATGWMHGTVKMGETISISSVWLPNEWNEQDSYVITTTAVIE